MSIPHSKSYNLKKFEYFFIRQGKSLLMKCLDITYWNTCTNSVTLLFEYGLKTMFQNFNALVIWIKSISKHKKMRGVFPANHRSKYLRRWENLYCFASNTVIWTLLKKFFKYRLHHKPWNTKYSIQIEKMFFKREDRSYAKKVLSYKKRREKEWITAETLAKINKKEKHQGKNTQYQINSAPGKT